MERPMMVQYAAMGRRIRQRRRELRLTQERLAEMASVSSAFVGQLERGEKIPSVETLARLCTCLGVDMDYLVFGMRQACDRERCALFEALRDLVEAHTSQRTMQPFGG